MGEGTARNIFLIGFSFTGKSSAGRSAARVLGWSYVDTDDEIVRSAGKPIAEIFAQDGESRFREMEREVVEKVCQGERQVVSTGGGAIVDAGNRQRMMESGAIICLEAKPLTIYERLLKDAEDNPGQEVRPLLAGNNPLGRIEWLKGVRQPVYALSDWTVHTDNLTVSEVAEEVVRGWRVAGRGRPTLPAVPDMRESDAPYCEHLGAACVVKTATESYPIFVGWGFLDQLGARMRNAGLRGRAHVVSDDNVFPLYGDKVLSILREAGFEAESMVVAAGEESKSFDTARGLYDTLVERRAERGDCVVALGGGVVGDLAGHVAATFLRGVPFVQVPTTVIGMVDSAIGGKVGINHPQGKNLIGAFYQPRLVLADVHTLSTLPRRELVSGWAEVVKHALIRGPQLLEELEGEIRKLSELDREMVTGVIAASAEIKARIVSEDEKERGVRTILNYGHTIGHGLEAATGYGRFLHGEAVAIGMIGAAMISHRVGLLSEDTVQRQRALLASLGLPTECTDVSVDEVERAMEVDKKMRDRKVRWVLLGAVGEVVIRDDVPYEVVHEAIRDLIRS